METTASSTQPIRGPEVDGQMTAAQPGPDSAAKPVENYWYNERTLKLRNKIIVKLRQALADNDLIRFNDLITEHQVTTGYRIHNLSEILISAIVADKPEFAERLIQRGILYSASYISVAARARAKRCLEMFFRYGVDINKPKNETQPPAWHVAGGDREMVYWLLDHGADLNVHAMCDFVTAMSTVVRIAPVDLVRDLLEDPRHLVDVLKGDLLFRALGRKTDVVPVLALLLDHGAPINEGMYSRYLPSQNLYCFMPRGPPLQEAAAKGQLDAVRFLLSRHADPTIRDTKGKTPLWHAQKWGHTEVAEVLQKAMAEFKQQHL